MSESTGTVDELAGLVPSRSRRATLVVGAIIVTAVALAWFAPPWLHPKLEMASMGAAYAWKGAPYELTQATLPDNQSAVTVIGVDDVAGARVAGVWVTYTNQEEIAVEHAMESAVQSGLVPGDPQAAIRTLIAGGAPFGGTKAPARVGPASSVWVLWEITDCRDAQTYDRGMTVRLRSPLGTTVVQRVTGSPGPFDQGTDWLLETDTCPR